VAAQRSWTGGIDCINPTCYILQALLKCWAALLFRDRNSFSGHGDFIRRISRHCSDDKWRAARNAGRVWGFFRFDADATRTGRLHGMTFGYYAVDQRNPYVYFPRSSATPVRYWSVFARRAESFDSHLQSRIHGNARSGMVMLILVVCSPYAPVLGVIAVVAGTWMPSSTDSPTWQETKAPAHAAGISLPYSQE